MKQIGRIVVCGDGESQAVASASGAKFFESARLLNAVADGASAPRLAALFDTVRQLTTDLCAPLSDADATIQSMPDASPAKWHLAHTTWFFETFVLRDHVKGYRTFDERYAYLFNSYYNGEGARHARGSRGMLSRPSLNEIIAYRRYVDQAMIDAFAHLVPEALALVELGCHHEQQHQELLLTDILNLFAQNPLCPALYPKQPRADGQATDVIWVEGATGLSSLGSDGPHFTFDCERPRHPIVATRHFLASRPVNNGEWMAFILDGGYDDPQFWLSDGWAWAQANKIDAPLYWRRNGEGDWITFGLSGLCDIDRLAPVSHISFYEADAYASWAGARLPTEAEWENAASLLDPHGGNLLDHAGPVAPRPGGLTDSAQPLSQMFGDVWEWTGSAYRPYPGFAPAGGTVGEYNGKFMSGQFILKGGSCATPRTHIRASYRNFFAPHQRWQFSGLRLAKDHG